MTLDINPNLVLEEEDWHSDSSIPIDPTRRKTWSKKRSSNNYNPGLSPETESPNKPESETSTGTHLCFTKYLVVDRKPSKDTKVH